jgi:outer membrane protein TolC
MVRNFAAMSSAIALAACASGPDYHPQPVSASAAAPFVMAQGSAVVSDVRPAGNWWRLYDDPVLDGLVRDALAANTDVRVAEARLQRARAALRGSVVRASRRSV